MLARLQRLVMLVLLVFVCGWAAVAWWQGRPAWMPGGLVVVVVGYLAFMAFEFVLAACVHGDDPAPRASLPQLAGAWWGEVTTSPRVFCWEQPFRADRVPDHLPDRPIDVTPADRSRGLVLVHGFVCNRGFWNRWMPRLVARGIPFVAVNLEPVFGPIDGYAPIIDAAVRRVTASTGQAPVIVAHSMGGLAVRAWLAASGADVHRVITIGSPHQGTWTARFGRADNAREMRGGSALLARLATSETPDVRARFTCFYSHCDNIVFPPSTAVIPGAENRHVPGVAHVELADHPAVFDAALRWVAPGSGS